MNQFFSILQSFKGKVRKKTHKKTYSFQLLLQQMSKRVKKLWNSKRFSKILAHWIICSSNWLWKSRSFSGANGRCGWAFSICYVISCIVPPSESTVTIQTSVYVMCFVHSFSYTWIKYSADIIICNKRAHPSLSIHL